MDLTKLSKTVLLAKCEELGIKNCKSKNKTDLIKLIENENKVVKEETNQESEPTTIKLVIEEAIKNDIPNVVEHETNIENMPLKFIDLFC